jgi:hypothetical protein
MANIRIKDIADESASPVRASTYLEVDSTAEGSQKINLDTAAGLKAFPFSEASPTTSTDKTLFFTPVAITVTKLATVVRGTTPSATVDIRHDPDRSAAGNALIATPSATTSESTGSVVTSFDDATIPADSWVWLEVDATSGTVDEVAGVIVFTQD